MSTLICTNCRRTHAPSRTLWRCPCGGLLDLVFEPAFHVERIRRRAPNLWRYREALPLDDDANIVSLGEGFTPLLPLELAGGQILIKQDHLCPTGSYKDRGATLLISKARELGVTALVEDSSGNAGAAIAAYGARAGLRCDIYVPQSTSPAKRAQIEQYGARIVPVPGPRADTADAVLAAADTTFYASHCWNPYFLHGTKTFAFEVCEQLGWHAPDLVFLPVGNGSLLLGAHIGFGELHRAGIIPRVPRLVGVQSANCAPLCQAFEQGAAEPAAVTPQPTIGEGIAIARPPRGRQILAAIRETDGFMPAVSEVEIADSMRWLHRQGFFVEPTAAVALAGVRRYVATARRSEVIVTALTGHGLKAVHKLAADPAHHHAPGTEA